MLWCAKNQNRTPNRGTRFKSTVGLPIPVLNPTGMCTALHSLGVQYTISFIWCVCCSLQLVCSLHFLCGGVRIILQYIAHICESLGICFPCSYKLQIMMKQLIFPNIANT